MSEARVCIDRLRIGIEGFPATLAVSAGPLLERALTDRLGSARPVSERALATHASVALGEVDAPAGIDPAALAGIIADRLVAWLQDPGGPEEPA